MSPAALLPAQLPADAPEEAVSRAKGGRRQSWVETLVPGCGLYSLEIAIIWGSELVNTR